MSSSLQDNILEYKGYMYMTYVGINITIYGSRVTCNYLLPYMVRHVITCSYNNCLLSSD